MGSGSTGKERYSRLDRSKAGARPFARRDAGDPALSTEAAAPCCGCLSSAKYLCSESRLALSRPSLADRRDGKYIVNTSSPRSFVTTRSPPDPCPPASSRPNREASSRAAATSGNSMPSASSLGTRPLRWKKNFGTIILSRRTRGHSGSKRHDANGEPHRRGSPRERGSIPAGFRLTLGGHMIQGVL
jgi:hypothetical protein